MHQLGMGQATAGQEKSLVACKQFLTLSLTC